MAKCSESDLAALTESGPLLRFAAERVKNLDPDLPLAIAEARAAAESDQWTPQISQRFWSTFARLCDLIQPVTMDCLAATHRNIEPCKWTRWRGGEKISIAERSSSRYLIALGVLLALILPIQLYVWTCTNLSKKIDEIFAADKTKLAQLSDDYRKLDAATRDRPSTTVWSADENTKADKITADAASIYIDVDRILYEASILEEISLFFLSNSTPVILAKPKKDEWYEHYRAATQQLDQVQLQVVKIQEKANLIVGIFASYILPILFGTIGAVAYVIRAIADQIRTSTFAINSPIRHVMRATLGALAGVVVGLFGGLSNQLSLSPLAVAFLAGYGVEAVFSMFDGLVEKFRQPNPTPQAQQQNIAPVS